MTITSLPSQYNDPNRTFFGYLQNITHAIILPMLNWLHIGIASAASVGIVVGGLYVTRSDFGAVKYSTDGPETATESTEKPAVETVTAPASWPAKLDTKNYDERLLTLAHYTPPAPIVIPASSSSPTTTQAAPSPLVYSEDTNVTNTKSIWPPAAPYPNGGAILPFYRVLAYYGNLYSRFMGILGEYEPEIVLEKLLAEKAAWEAADPTTPVMPAIQYIAIVAQAAAGADGMYRAVMPDSEIDKAYQMAKDVDGIFFLDIQVGKSTVQAEVPKFRDYLTQPDVHFAIDPEFSMKTGAAPGHVIGTFNAEDINWVIDYMSEIVRENELPPKILIVHRFTQDMVTGYNRIQPTPEVQVVMDMDGWGSKDLKYGTYSHIIVPEPVQFTGLKIFYKNDLKPPSTGLLTPAEVLNLRPRPIYIQYQ